MKAEQLYFTIIVLIGMYLIVSSLDMGLTTTASKKTGPFVNGAEVWTKVIFGVLAGTSIIYLVWFGTSPGQNSSGVYRLNNNLGPR
jgi:hypothetical protein